MPSAKHLPNSQTREARPGYENWILDNKIPISLAFLSGLFLYSSLWTQFVLNDHTLPNIYLYNYPSFKTGLEGRWFADFLIWAGGSQGAQSFQAIAGFLLQALSGVLFADLLRVKKAI